ncbi:uncharacterized protein LOC110181673 [Drosophila serrata]|uniref:uncharacterized protein LOC110181673 n=1 Tax=Drosophila serrata TaxID=7274 RepID=UPI000A1D0188|nr:uncharacterized protein LOC110181673 [Drosophila serrata]
MSSISTEGEDYFPSEESSDTGQDYGAVSLVPDLGLEEIYMRDSYSIRSDTSIVQSEVSIDEGYYARQALNSLFADFVEDAKQITRSAFEDSIRERSGCQDLRNILLLITPLELPNLKPEERKVHCYCLDTRRHQGVITVTLEEVHLIKRYHGPAKTYTVVHCSKHIQLADAAGNTPIRCLIFDVVREASKVARMAWYKGNEVRVSYCGNGSKRPVPSKRESSGIPSLRQPKIPVRMQSPISSKAKNAQNNPPNQKANPKTEAKVGQRNMDGKNNRSKQQRSNQPKINTQKPTQVPKKTVKTDRRTPVVESSRPKKPNPTKAKLSDSAPISSTVEASLEEQLPELDLGQSPQMIDQLDDCITTVEEAIKGLQQGRPDVEEVPLPDRLDSSTLFGRRMEPPVLPPSFSSAAFSFLEGKLRWPSARKAFLKLKRLVNKINKQPCPRGDHLLRFFHMAQDLDFKMYIRREIDFPGWSSKQGRRYVVDCYVFDDRREYIASISLLDTQLHALARLFPRAQRNFRLIDNAFELTPMPKRLTKMLKATLNVFHAQRLFKYLGQLTLGFARSPGAVFDLPDDQET